MLFLTLTVAGLVGLLMMALPAFGGHGHAHATHGGRVILGRSAGPARLLGHAGASARGESLPATVAPAGALRWVPSPRAIFSVVALYGAFGNALVHAGHLRFATAALAAAVPALLVERLVVRPVWNLLFRFQGTPSSPLGALILSEARAVVAFRNGRGVVSVVRDGRVVQLPATLRPDHAALPVRVGDILRTDDVDVRRERVTVSIVAHGDD